MAIFAARGIAYHCKHCGETQYVDFVGGTQMIELEEVDYLKQVDLSKKHQCDDDWIHDEECICEECILKNTTMIERINSERLSRVLDTLDKLYKLQNKTKYHVKLLCNKFIKNIIENKSFNYVGLKNDMIGREYNSSDLKNKTETIYNSEKHNIFRSMFKWFMPVYLESSKEFNKDREKFYNLEYKYDEYYDLDWNGIIRCYRECKTRGKINFNNDCKNKSSKVALIYKKGQKNMFKEYNVTTDNLRFPEDIINFPNFFASILESNKNLVNSIIKEIEYRLQYGYPKCEQCDSDDSIPFEI